VSDYKHTLNLPQTDFPMRANLAKRALGLALRQIGPHREIRLRQVEGMFVVAHG
jgi:hypothetical protein